MNNIKDAENWNGQKSQLAVAASIKHISGIRNNAARKHLSAVTSDTIAATRRLRNHAAKPYMTAITIIMPPHHIRILRTTGTDGLYAMKSLIATTKLALLIRRYGRQTRR